MKGVPRWILAIGLVSVTALGACDSLTYAPDGDHAVAVDSSAAPVAIDLSEAADTLVLWNEVALGYEIADPRPVRRVEVLFGEEVVQSVASAGPVTVDTRALPDGQYRLRVRVFVRSETGSLADVYGREVVVGEAERVAFVDNAAPSRVPVTSLTSEQGQLAVRWEAVGRPGFQEYRVYQVGPEGVRELRATIRDRNATVWRDSLVAGGTARYAVDVKVSDQVAEGRALERDFGQAEIERVEALGREALRVTWGPSPFPENVAAYVIERADGHNSARELARLSPAGTSWEDAPPDLLGASYTYTVRAVGHAPGVETASAPVRAGYDPAVVANVVYGYAPAANAFIGQADRYQATSALVRLDAVSFEETGRIGTPEGPAVGMSPAGQIVLAGETLQVVDPVAFRVVQQFNRATLLGTARPMLTDAPFNYVFTDEGVLLASYGEYHSPAFYAGLGLLAIDLVGGRVVDRIDATGRRPPSFYPDYTTVELRLASPDGAYLLVETRGSGLALYERDASGSFVRLGPATLPVLTGAWFLSDREFVINDVSQGRLRVYEVPSLQEVRQVSAARRLGGARFDRLTGTIYGWVESFGGTRRVVGLDVATGRQVFDVSVAPYVNEVEYVGGILWAGGRARRMASLGPSAGRRLGPRSPVPVRGRSGWRSAERTSEWGSPPPLRRRFPTI